MSGIFLLSIFVRADIFLLNPLVRQVVEQSTHYKKNI
jgi:hypothetical protein